MWAIFLETGLLLLILGWIAWALWGPTPKEFLKPPPGKDEEKDSNGES